MSRLVPLIAVLLAAAVIVQGANRPAPQSAPPAEQHRYVQADVGTWKGTLTMTMPGLGEQAIPCTEVVTPVGDYWTTSRFECELMGTPFLGWASLGYDPARGAFVGTWIDSMTTELAVMEGAIDEQSGALVLRWEATDPMTGQRGPHRSETLRDGETRTSTFFHGAGEGAKSMVLTLERQVPK